MADDQADQERFDAEIDLGVSFNEFDDELSELSERNGDYTDKTNQKDMKRQNVGTANDPMFLDDTCKLLVQNETVKTHRVTNGNYTENVPSVAKTEEGEVPSSSDDEDGEKMDFDEELVVDLNTVSQETAKSAESNAEETKEIATFKFLPPGSAMEECSKTDTTEEELMSDTAKGIDEAEREILSMESDNSMDDQSWKRHKRARLEQDSRESSVERKKDGKDGERVKTRGGKKKRKRPLRDDHDRGRHQRSYNEKEPEIGSLFEPLKVTSEDSEEAVAKEIAGKLNETKTNLIQRVVRCIGCEKTLKLFRDTKEVQLHGGMWTKDRKRRRTSGGVFLAILKERYVTKEQNKWIFAVENEICKRKAKEQQQRLKELQRKEVEDLRRKLKQRDQE